MALELLHTIIWKGQFFGNWLFQLIGGTIYNTIHEGMHYQNERNDFQNCIHLFGAKRYLSNITPLFRSRKPIKKKDRSRSMGCRSAQKGGDVEADKRIWIYHFENTIAHFWLYMHSWIVINQSLITSWKDATLVRVVLIQNVQPYSDDAVALELCRRFFKTRRTNTTLFVNTLF